MIEQTYTLKEVAAYYKVDERTMRRRIQEPNPEIGHMKCGGRIVFKQKHLDDYDRRHEVKPVL